MLLRRQFRYCVTSLADVGEESITTQYYSFLSSLGGLVVERLNCSICTTQKFHLLFVVLLERRDKKKSYFSAFSTLSVSFPWRWSKLHFTLMKKGLTRSLMWGHLAHLFVGCSSRTSVSFFGSFWGRSYDSFISSSKSRGEHETRVKKGFGLREKLGKVLLFWFSINLSHFLSIFPNPLRSSNNGNTPPAVLMYLTSRSSCRSIKSIWGIWVVWRRLRRLRRKWSQSVFFQRRSFEKNLTGQNGEV